jgi:hypothetical protein
MSQEKVNRYKEEKANRKAKIRRDRFKSMVRKLILLVLSVALVGWVAYSAVVTYQANRPRDMVTVNYESITDYLQALGEDFAEETPVEIFDDADLEGEGEAETEEEDGAEVEGEDDAEGDDGAEIEGEGDAEGDDEAEGEGTEEDTVE